MCDMYKESGHEMIVSRPSLVLPRRDTHDDDTDVKEEEMVRSATATAGHVCMYVYMYR